MAFGTPVRPSHAASLSLSHLAVLLLTPFLPLSCCQVRRDRLRFYAAPSICFAPKHTKSNQRRAKSCFATACPACNKNAMARFCPSACT